MLLKTIVMLCLICSQAFNTATASELPAKGENVTIVDYGVDLSNIAGRFKQNSDGTWTDTNNTAKTKTVYQETGRDEWTVYLSDGAHLNLWKKEVVKGGKKIHTIVASYVVENAVTTVAVPAANNIAVDWSSHYSSDMGELRLDEMQWIKDHNSYEHAKPVDIVSRLNHSLVLELDLWSHGKDWRISHSSPGTNSPLLSEYLNELAKWHENNPKHPLIIVNLDRKNKWSDKTRPDRIDSIIYEHFKPEDIYRPIDLKGNKPDVRTAARMGGWKKMKDLKGKVMFILTGGFFISRNQGLRAYVKEQIMEKNYEGVAFVAPDINDADDIFYDKGNLDAINKEKQHIVVFNANWNNRNKFDSDNVKDQNILMHFWNVPASKEDFGAAVDQYKSSIIALAGKAVPNQAEVDKGKKRTGKRGRIMVTGPVVIFYGDDNGWDNNGDIIKLKPGEYDNKGKGGRTKLPGKWNDEVRAVNVPKGLTVYMTDDDSFKEGRNGTVTIKGPVTVNIKDRNRKLAGKISSIRITTD